ncbi:MAG: FAD-dependent oxidoreductase [Chthoniobacterales bacterium]|nr:FAD-dependent oxidoreductase [Chthoniobacterales bacterium]
MQHIAIIGSGIAGLTAAYYLRPFAQITILEKNTHFGGHTNTRIIEENGIKLPIDTGFIVFNKVTYPNLLRLFQELGIHYQPAEMSFSLRHDIANLEYNGSSLLKLFGQLQNLFRPRFYRFLCEVLKFFRISHHTLKNSHSTPPAHQTLHQFVQANKLSQDFYDWYLLPMSSALWSTAPSQINDFPAQTLLRFFHNHGFLGIFTHHRWFTVKNGAHSYVQKILNQPGIHAIHCPIHRIRQTDHNVEVLPLSGSPLRFDRVILATHADQALALLESPSQLQIELLSPFHYQKNHAILHTDTSVLPKHRSIWASWNFLVRQNPHPPQKIEATVHYWMNALQRLPTRKNYIVSLNSHHFISPQSILYETTYEHPTFTSQTETIQPRLHQLNSISPNQKIYFCGSYFRYGFHEDACWSALQLAKTLRQHLHSQ